MYLGGGKKSVSLVPDGLLKSKQLYYKWLWVKYVLSYNVNQTPEYQRGRINMYKSESFSDTYYLCYFSS